MSFCLIQSAKKLKKNSLPQQKMRAKKEELHLVLINQKKEIIRNHFKIKTPERTEHFNRWEINEELVRSIQIKQIVEKVGNNGNRR